MPSYKLTYFNMNGLGEVARLLLAAAGVEFEDVRLEKEQWPEFKPKTPFGQMPVLEVDEMMLAQSNTINRYLATQFGFAGKNDLEAARVDMIVDGMVDFEKTSLQMYYTQNETEKEELKEKFLQETVPQTMEKFEKLLISNNGGDGYFVGDGLTWADIIFSDHIHLVPVLTGSDVEWDKFPKLKALKARVEAVPKIAEWIKNIPQT